MKIAIGGMGPAGLEASLHFYHLGAELKIFEMDEFGGCLLSFPQDFLMEGAWREITSELGRNVSALKIDLSIRPTVAEYLNHYFYPIVKNLNLLNFARKAQILRVHKRFLQIDQEIPSATRLRDLFRVVFSQEVVIDEANNEYYNDLVNKLGEMVVNSLKESIEHFEDFDLVLDCTGSYAKPQLAGPSGTYAIGEERLKTSQQLVYGLKNALNKIKDLKNEKQIAVDGTTLESALVLILLENWIFSEGHSLRLLSLETEPFSELLNSKSIYIREIGERARMILDRNLEMFEVDKRIFESKVEEWKNLEDFVRAKIPKPIEPLAKIDVIIGGVITALDKLIDQDKIYVTVEFPTFLTNNAKSDLVTIAQDLVFVLKASSTAPFIAKGLRVGNKGPIHSEPGFYSLHGTLTKIISDIHLIETDLMKYFSRV